MKVLNLACSHGHGFEGWFGSEEAYRDQSTRGLVTCPVCGDSGIVKLPSAPRLNLGHGQSRGAATKPPNEPTASTADNPARPEEEGAHHGISLAGAPAAELNALKAAWWRAAREAVRSAEDVGERFADEARRIHHGDAESRGIRGQASHEEARALLEEGIGVLPLPDALKETLQ